MSLTLIPVRLLPEPLLVLFVVHIGVLSLDLLQVCRSVLLGSLMRAVLYHVQATH